MRQLLFLISIGIFTVGLAGCGAPPEDTTATSSPTASPGAAPGASASPGAEVSPQPNATPTPGQIAPFKDPLVKEGSNVAAGAGLIQSTNSEERLNLLGKRSTATPVAPATTTAPSSTVADPFAVLPPLILQTTPNIGEAPEPPEQVTRAVPDLPKLPEAEPPLPWRNISISIPSPQTGNPNTGFTPPTGQGRAASPNQTRTAPMNSTPISPNRNLTGSPANPVSPNTQTTAPRHQTVAPRRTVPTLPNLPIAQVPDLPALPNTTPPTAWRDPNPPPKPVVQPLTPPPPSTDLAQGMEVTGILQVGNQTKVILKAPAEPTSRYVNVGQRVSNGQVLVKGVKFDSGGEPIVIFEQNGIEIAKSVGAINPPPNQPMNNISLQPARAMS